MGRANQPFSQRPGLASARSVGEIIMRKAEALKEQIRAAGRQAIEENQEALRILDAHDRGEG